MPSLKSSNDIKVHIKTDADVGGVDKANRSIEGLGDASTRSGKAAGALGTLLKTGTVAAIGAAGSAAVYGVKQFGDFEQSLNIFQSVSGATGNQMVDVAAKARELGKDISLPGVSSKDAAGSMVELAKAGLTVNDAMAASKGVLSLAKAGQLDTAHAAEIAANALNAFGLKGTEATRVADVLAAAANASSADVGDLAMALQMTSASAAANKVPLEDTVALLGQMANNGIKGSDAGTSLKTMLSRLTPQTDEAAEAMAKLNLDFYDAKGNFVGMREVARQLQDRMKNLTDEQKQQTIYTIFGSDAMRAANIIVKEGVGGYDAMSTAVQKQGAATELAAAQNKGFKGALDGLKSTLETVATDVGSHLAPSLTVGVNKLNEFITGVNLSAQKNKEVSRTVTDWRTEISMTELAQRALKDATNEVVTSTQNLNNMVMQEAPLQAAAASAKQLVAQRQRELNDAIRQHGPQSDQAWLATLRLQDSQGQLNQRFVEVAGNALNVTNAEGHLKWATDRLNDANITAIRLTGGLANHSFPGLQSSMWGVQVQAVRTGDQLQNSLNVGVATQGRLNGKLYDLQTTSSNVTGVIMGNFGQIQGGINNVNANLNQMGGSSGQLRVTNRAAGGPVSAGAAYAVGDNPDGSWNRTTELFVPRTSGTIVPAHAVQEALGGASGGGGLSLTFTGPVYMRDEEETMNTGRQLARALNSARAGAY